MAAPKAASLGGQGLALAGLKNVWGLLSELPQLPLVWGREAGWIRGYRNGWGQGLRKLARIALAPAQYPQSCLWNTLVSSPKCR